MLAVRRLLFLALFATLAGCAVANRTNRPTTNFLDRKINPETVAAQVLLAPVVIPVGLASLTLDAAVVHPVRMAPRAYNSTANLIWRGPQGGFLRRSFLFVPKVVLTPVYFSGNLLARSLFNLP